MNESQELGEKQICLEQRIASKELIFEVNLGSPTENAPELTEYKYKKFWQVPFVDLVKFVKCTLVSRVHMTF